MSSAARIKNCGTCFQPWYPQPNTCQIWQSSLVNILLLFWHPITDMLSGWCSVQLLCLLVSWEGCQNFLLPLKAGDYIQMIPARISREKQVGIFPCETSSAQKLLSLCTKQDELAWNLFWWNSSLLAELLLLLLTKADGNDIPDFLQAGFISVLQDVLFSLVHACSCLWMCRLNFAICDIWFQEIPCIPIFTLHESSCLPW